MPTCSSEEEEDCDFCVSPNKEGEVMHSEACELFFPEVLASETDTVQDVGVGAQDRSTPGGEPTEPPFSHAKDVEAGTHFPCFWLLVWVVEPGAAVFS